MFPPEYVKPPRPKGRGFRLAAALRVRGASRSAKVEDLQARRKFLLPIEETI